MDLEFTRGDTQFIKFQLKDAKGNSLEITNSEKIYFTVKQNQNSKKILIQKRYPSEIKFSDGYFYIELTSEDTSNLNYGTYQYDIEFKTGEFVKTLGFGTITLTEEITHKGDE